MAFIIAEIGSNHDGTINSCAQAIGQAKAVGADAVKFQLIFPDDLYGPHKKEEYKGSIDPQWLPQLKEKADACGIEFMCSAFSIKGYKIIDNYVKRHKIASPENNHVLILEELNKMGKPVIMSCGASHPFDIRKSLEILSSVDVTLLYCSSSYPCPEVRLEKISALKATFPTRKVGFSDHSKDYTCAPVEACKSFSAVVLEKHLSVGGHDSPDMCVSIDPSQFLEMVNRIKTPYSFEYLPEKQEKEALLKYKRRLVAVTAINKGAWLSPSMVGIYRVKEGDQKGLSPFLYKTLFAKQSSKDYSVGDTIG